MNKITLITKPEGDYELLDSGKEEKLERYGDVVLVRPDPQALWEKHLAEDVWKKADGTYERSGKDGQWQGSGLKKEWQITFGGMHFLIKPTSFKHTGLFPEQLPNWEWLQKILLDNSGEKRSVLNLFAYTGGATLAAAKAGAEVCHVDASKTAVAWARENAKLSGMEEKPIRWIVEDVLEFVRREIKRGKKYDAIIMDPPAFGHGPTDEVWKIEEHILELVSLCMELLSDKPLCVLINGYAAGYSPLSFGYMLEPFVKKLGGTLECGELTIGESNSERLLPSGIFARWSAV